MHAQTKTSFSMSDTKVLLHANAKLVDENAKLKALVKKLLEEKSKLAASLIFWCILSVCLTAVLAWSGYCAEIIALCVSLLGVGLGVGRGWGTWLVMQMQDD